MQEKKGESKNGNTAMNRRKLLGSLGATGVAMTAGCMGGDDEGGAGGDGLRAAFVYDGRIGDQGWIHTHNEGRLAAEDELDWLETDYQENVDPAESERVMDDFAEAGYDVVYPTSVTFDEAAANASERHPDTIFEVANGYTPGENLSGYSVRYYEGRYALGVAAGLLTETDRIGFIGAVAVPLTFRDINSFALGAQSVNPDITLVPRLMNTFYAPQDATSTVQDFASDDIDVIATNLDTTATVSACNDEGIWGCGRDSSQREAGGDTYLSAVLSEWDGMYKDISESVRDGAWDNQPIWQGFDEGGVAIDEFGPNVPDDVIEEVMETRDEIVNGNIDIWEGSRFEGQSEDPTGEIRAEMTEYVDAVEGDAP